MLIVDHFFAHQLPKVRRQSCRSSGRHFWPAAAAAQRRSRAESSGHTWVLKKVRQLEGENRAAVVCMEGFVRKRRAA